MLHLVKVIQQRNFLGHLIEIYLSSHPLQALYRPRLYPHQGSPGHAAVETCSADAVLEVHPAWPLLGREPDPATPREPHPAPTPALALQVNIQLANVLSDVSGMTGQAIIKAILAGQRDPHKLAAFRDPRVKASEEQIARNLEGN
jgi:hypothetical protein